jgi:hypothetical protein
LNEAEVGSWNTKANESGRRIVELKEQIKWKKNSSRRSAEDVCRRNTGKGEQISGRRIAVEEVKK